MQHEDRMTLSYMLQDTTYEVEKVSKSERM